MGIRFVVLGGEGVQPSPWFPLGSGPTPRRPRPALPVVQNYDMDGDHRLLLSMVSSQDK